MIRGSACRHRKRSSRRSAEERSEQPKSGSDRSSGPRAVLLRFVLHGELPESTPSSQPIVLPTPNAAAGSPSESAAPRTRARAPAGVTPVSHAPQPEPSAADYPLPEVDETALLDWVDPERRTSLEAQAQAERLELVEADIFPDLGGATRPRPPIDESIFARRGDCQAVCHTQHAGVTRPPTREELLAIGQTSAEVGGSFIPGVGEALDLAVIADPSSTWWETGLAYGSLLVSGFTLGIAPNAGAFIRGGTRFSDTFGGVAEGGVRNVPSTPHGGTDATARLFAGEPRVDVLPGGRVVEGTAVVRGETYPGGPILFGQRRASPSFRANDTPAPPTIAGRPITEVAEALRQGDISPDDLPIEVFEHQGVLVTLNNRGLAALTLANVEPTRVIPSGGNAGRGQASPQHSAPQPPDPRPPASRSQRIGTAANTSSR